MTDNVTNTEAAFAGGFSFRDNVIGKPSDPAGMNLGEGWKWAPKAQPDHLLNACTVQGMAVTPGKWAKGHKSKKHSSMIECGYILLDWDEGMSWEECKTNDYLIANALFAYTSPSHQQPGKGDRFRVAFALDTQVYRPEVIDRLIQMLHTKVPGSDRAINSSSLLYGNPNSLVHIYSLDNRLEAQSLYFEWAVADAQKKFQRGQQLQNVEAGERSYEADNSIRRLQRWLSFIPNNDRSTWVKVAGCLRNVEAYGHEWAYPLFEEWSAKDYSDFDPDACERLWESLTAQPGGFRRLKEISQHYQETQQSNQIV